MRAFMHLRFVFVVLVLFYVGCTGEYEPDQNDARPVVERAIQAHGGMEGWQSLRNVTWQETITRFSGNEPSETTARKVYYKKTARGQTMMRIEQSGGSIEHLDESLQVYSGELAGFGVIGFDGEEAWYQVDGVLDTSEEARRSARYITVAFMYWFDLPFKLLDPGVHWKLLPQETRNGKTVERVEVTFEPGVGDNPTDRFVYSFDSETGRIAHINFWRLNRLDRPRLGQWKNYVQVGDIWKESLRVFFNVKTKEKASERRFEYLEVNSNLPDSLFRPDDPFTKKAK